MSPLNDPLKSWPHGNIYLLSMAALVVIGITSLNTLRLKNEPMHERQYLGLHPSSQLGWSVRLLAGYCLKCMREVITKIGNRLSRLWGVSIAEDRFRS